MADCLMCKEAAPDASFFVFYYGTRGKTESTGLESKSSFHFEGQVKKRICKACLSGHKKRCVGDFFRWVFIALAELGVFWWILDAPRDLDDLHWFAWLWIGMTIGVGLLQLLKAFKGEEELGDGLLLEIYQESLFGQGYNDFYTRQNYRKMENQEPGSGPSDGV